MNDQPRTDLIESKIDRSVAGAMSLTSVGVGFRSMGEVMEFAKLMAVSGPAVPDVYRGNPGACLAVTLQAVALSFEPFAFARMTYWVNGQIAYMSQLINAIILARAPFVKRPDTEFSGDGVGRRCKVTFYFSGDDKKVYESPPLAGITPKNSPLWKSDPDQQLAYYSIRAAARRYCPDVILGMYDPEEMAAALAKDITPRAPIAEKLATGKKPEVTYIEPHGQPPPPQMPVEAPAEAKESQVSGSSAGVPETSEATPEPPQGTQSPSEQETSHDAAQVAEAQAKPEGEVVAPSPGTPVAADSGDALTEQERTALYELGTELAGIVTASDLHAVQELWAKTIEAGSPAFKKAAAEKYTAKIAKLGKGKRK